MQQKFHATIHEEYQLIWWFWKNDRCHSHLSSAHNNSLAWHQKIFIFNNQLEKIMREKYPCHSPSHFLLRPLHFCSCINFLSRVFTTLLCLLTRQAVSPIPKLCSLFHQNNLHQKVWIKKQIDWLMYKILNLSQLIIIKSKFTLIKISK